MQFGKQKVNKHVCVSWTENNEAVSSCAKAAVAATFSLNSAL